MPIGAPSTCAICDFGARDLVGHRRRGGGAIADREPADLAGGAQVAFHQRRRKRLRIGDVVEAVADGIGRQERIDIDLDAQQIANGARILGAVRALERTESGIGVERRRAIDAFPRARDASAISASSSGRFAPAGGIMPARSLRIIFSVTSPWVAACAASNDASERPPALRGRYDRSRSTCLTIAVCSAAVSDAPACATAMTGARGFLRRPAQFVARPV